ncbi:5-formyltetrahydrofolate cyclo-ligase [Pseudomaricurvus sp. HS19]|nr:5-formyltetrahydrofolate cyclo-ligase [Pseudomaricurvus sp. HS19]
MDEKRTQLRQTLRSRRRALSAEQQQHASRRVCQHLLSMPLLHDSHHIALYLPNDGEIDPTPLLQELWHRGKFSYLPVLTPGQRLKFVRYTPDTPMITNRYGIDEPHPDYDQHLEPEQLQLVLMPLVGFDSNCGRLGMGGGFYDRTFAFRIAEPGRGPALVGLAHECQRVEQLPLESWDVPLQAVVTDRELIANPALPADGLF